MGKSNLQILHKDNLERFAELYQAVYLLRDFMNHFIDGQFFYLYPFYGQLRAILTDKSRGKLPLLFDITEKTDYSLDVFYWLPKDTGSDNGLTYGFTDPQLSFYKPSVDFKKIHLKEYIEKVEFLQVDDLKFTHEKFIEFIANNLGGAHYSPFMELYKYKLKSFTHFNLVGYSKKFGEAITLKTIDFIKKFTDMAIGFGFILYKTKNKIKLLDLNLPNTPMSVKLFLNHDNTLQLNLIDYFGVVINLTSRYKIKRNEYNVIYLSFTIDSRMKGRIKLFVNNRLYISYFGSSFLIINEFHSYNRQILTDSKKYEIGFTFFEVYNEVWKSTIRKSYIDDKIEEWHQNTSFMVFKDGEYLTAKPFERNLTIIGSPSFINI
ncbi:MAG: hypothetical protein K9H64_04795 [Bacteroidales bacterium]|nr:hypothetical protein [Bacteroidales bacterium]MCF8455078.1 hypothetical protein [Bacteroidales bacterium]